MQQTTSYITQVTRILNRYPLVKAAYENEKQLERIGLGNLFPALSACYGERVSGGTSEYLSTTEKFGIKRAEHALIVEQVERSLSVLTPDERRLIHYRYFCFTHSDRVAYTYLEWSKAKYYRIKRKALRKIATVLNLI